jgi:hypothetical protein
MDIRTFHPYESSTAANFNRRPPSNPRPCPNHKPETRFVPLHADTESHDAAFALRVFFERGQNPTKILLYASEVHLSHPRHGALAVGLGKWAGSLQVRKGIERYHHDALPCDLVGMLLEFVGVDRSEKLGGHRTSAKSTRL